MTKKKPILLLGSYGRGNIGDDVFLVAALELFHDRKIYVNSADDKLLPEAAKGKVNTIRTDNVSDIFKKISLFLSISTVVYWGGDVWVKWYENKWQTRPLYQMVILNTLLRLFGKKIAYVGCGIGDLSGYSLTLARLSAKLAHYIIVREKRSANVLSLANIKVLPDIAVNLPYLQPTRHKPLAGKKMKVAISILYHIPDPKKNFFKLTENISNSLIQLDPSNYELILVPMLVSTQTDHDDLWASQQLYKKMNMHGNVSVSRTASLEEACKLFSRCDLVIGARLHACILTSLQGTPCIGISYRPKVRSFYEDNKLLDMCISLDEVDKLADKIENIHKNYDNTVKRFAAISNQNLAARKAYQDIAIKI